MNIEQSETLGSRRFLDFQELTSDQRKELEAAIKESRGWIELWVHTHYDEASLQENSQYAIKEVGAKYFSLRERLIKSLRQKQRMPVVALVPQTREDKLAIDYVQEYRLLESSHPLYFITTLPDDPTPVKNVETAELSQKIKTLDTKNPADLSDDDVRVIEAVWNRSINSQKLRAVPGDEWPHMRHVLERMVAERLKKEQEASWLGLWQNLKELGVEGIIVRGRNYFSGQPFFQSSNVEDEYDVFSRQHFPKSQEVPSGCVGELCKRVLLSGFKIRLSLITYPHQPPTDFRRDVRTL